MEAAALTHEGVQPRPEVVMHGVEERPRGWLEWLTTTDHKKIGILYLFATFVFFIITSASTPPMMKNTKVAKR